MARIDYCHCWEAALRRFNRLAANPMEDETHYADGKGYLLEDGAVVKIVLG